MAVAITQRADPAGTTASIVGSVASYAAQSIGTASQDRIVVLSVGTEVASGTINSATINYGNGPVAMKPLAQATFGNNSARQFWLNVPIGTTADFAITLGATPTTTNQHITVYSVTGAYLTVTSGAYVSTDMDATSPLYAIWNGNASGTPTQTTMRTDILTNGGFLACVSGADDATGVTWSGATEDLDEDAGDFRWSTAKTITGASATIKCTGATNAADGAMSWAVFCPSTGAFGSLKASGGQWTANITNPFQPLAPITVEVGDLVVINTVEITSATISGITDDLGHTGTALTTSGTNKSYYYIVTTAGDATISAAATASAHDAIIAVAVYNGPFTATPLDKNPAMLSDSTSPYSSNLSGTLSQANELLVGYFSEVAAAGDFFSSPSPGRVDTEVTAGVGSSVGAVITSTVVSATTSTAMAISPAGLFVATLCGVATFKLSTTNGFTSAALTTGALVLDTPTLVQNHNFTATELDTGALVFGTPSLTHTLTGTVLTTGALVFGTPVITQTHNLTASTLTTGALELGTPVITQMHFINATVLTTGALVFGTPSLTHTLTGTVLTTGALVLGNPIIEQTLFANNLTTGALALGTPVITQMHFINATVLTTGALVFGTPIIEQTLFANNLTTGALVLQSPILTTTGFLILGTVVDNGFGSFALANKILLCSNNPTTYTEATSTFLIGTKDLGIGNVLSSGPSADANGMKVTIAAVTSGIVNNNGTPLCWAIVDDANTRLLAKGPLLSTIPLTTALVWGLDAFILHWVAH